MMMKLILIIPVTLLFIATSCNPPGESSQAPSSYELNLTTGDTINMTVNGLKQGKWIETKAGKKDTLYYRNGQALTHLK
jgi:hypothetical protein